MPRCLAWSLAVEDQVTNPKGSFLLGMTWLEMEFALPRRLGGNVRYSDRTLGLVSRIAVVETPTNGATAPYFDTVRKAAITDHERRFHWFGS